MKKLLMFVCIMVMVTAYASDKVTGNNADYSYIEIKDSLYSVVDSNGANAIWKGPDYHAGGLVRVLNLIASDIPDEVKTPDDGEIYMILADIYGIKRIERRDTTTIPHFFNEIKNSYLDENKKKLNIEIPMTRGGHYCVDFGVQGLDYYKKDTIIARNEPSFGYNGFQTTIGKDLYAMTYYHTGFPFNLNELTGKEYVKYKISYWTSDSTMIPTEHADSITLRLKDEDHPFIEGYDSVAIYMSKPKPGKYHLDIESNFEKGNQQLDFDVNDTVRVTATLDKAEYALGTDKQAKLRVHVERLYPYIMPTQEYTTPTVAFKSTVLNNTDSLVIANDSLQSKPLNETGEISIGFDEITSDYLSEHGNKVDLTLNVYFNEFSVHNETLTLLFNQGETGISNVSKDNTENHVVYGIDGKRDNKNKERLPKGIYIINNKKLVK